MRPTTPAEVRTFLNRRATERPRNEAPAVRIDGTTATLRLFDPIDSWGEWWGMSAKEFARTLDELPGHIATIELLINSPGGDAFDGMAIVNVLRAHKARTVAVVQGLAASAASFIACAADELVMAPNSTLMIHDAWGVCMGNADDMLEFGSVLDKLSDNIADIYAVKSGDDVADIRAAMKAEAWYSAEDAVAANLADRVEEYTDPAPDASNRLDSPIAETPRQPAAALDTQIADPATADQPTAGLDEAASGRDRDELELLAI
jgi:ATP-dependent protease ClpP protease subunit